MQEWLNDSIADLLENDLTRRQDLRACHLTCSFAEKLLQYVMENLRYQFLWPPREIRCNSLASTWEYMEDDAWTRLRFDQCGIYGCVAGCLEACFQDRRSPDHVCRRLRELLEDSEAMVRRLCYECFLQGDILLETCNHNKGEAVEAK